MCGVPSPALPITREGVVLLEEQLPAGVEAVASAAPSRPAAARDRSTIRPIAVSQSVSTSRPPSRTSGRVSRSAERPTACCRTAPSGPSRPWLTTSLGAAADADHPPVLDRDVAAAAVAAQHARRLHPPVHVAAGTAGSRYWSTLPATRSPVDAVSATPRCRRCDPPRPPPAAAYPQDRHLSHHARKCISATSRPDHPRRRHLPNGCGQRPGSLNGTSPTAAAAVEFHGAHAHRRRQRAA